MGLRRLADRRRAATRPLGPRRHRAFGGGLATYAATTNDLIRAAAKRLDVPLVEGDAIRDPGLFFDMIHLGPEGCAMLADRVAPAVVRAIDAKKGIPQDGP